MIKVLEFHKIVILQEIEAVRFKSFVTFADIQKVRIWSTFWLKKKSLAV